MPDHAAETERTIDAPIERVFTLLTTSESHSRMMFGATVTTDWRVGMPITWSGEWEGKPFTDHGRIVEIDPPHSLIVTHESGSGGGEHTVRWTLTQSGPDATSVRVVQDGNDSPEAAEHAAGNWAASLEQLDRIAADG